MPLSLSRFEDESLTILVPGYPHPITIRTRINDKNSRQVSVSVDAPAEVKVYRTEKMAEWGIEVPTGAIPPEP